MDALCGAIWRYYYLEVVSIPLRKRWEKSLVDIGIGIMLVFG